MKRGQFITLEGGEGVGKSSNLVFIQGLLEQAGKKVVVTREPGGTMLAEKMRALLLDQHEESITPVAELLLMFAARSQHIAQIIEPALAAGKWVLCDRFTDATFAYQGGGRGMEAGRIAWLERCVQGELQPDMTLLLDAPVSIGMARARGRASLDRFESEQLDFFERVRQTYLQLAEQHGQRFVVIDAAQSLDAVQHDIKQVLFDRLS